MNYRVNIPVESVADWARLPHEANLLDMDTSIADVVPLAAVKVEI